MPCKSWVVVVGQSEWRSDSCVKYVGGFASCFSDETGELGKVPFKTRGFSLGEPGDLGVPHGILQRVRGIGCCRRSPAGMNEKKR